MYRWPSGPHHAHGQHQPEACTLRHSAVILAYHGQALTTRAVLFSLVVEEYEPTSDGYAWCEDEDNPEEHVELSSELVLFFVVNKPLFRYAVLSLVR